MLETVSENSLQEPFSIAGCTQTEGRREVVVSRCQAGNECREALRVGSTEEAKGAFAVS